MALAFLQSARRGIAQKLILTVTGVVFAALVVVALLVNVGVIRNSSLLLDSVLEAVREQQEQSAGIVRDNGTHTTEELGRANEAARRIVLDLYDSSYNGLLQSVANQIFPLVEGFDYEGASAIVRRMLEATRAVSWVRFRTARDAGPRDTFEFGTRTAGENLTFTHEITSDFGFLAIEMEVSLAEMEKLAEVEKTFATINEDNERTVALVAKGGEETLARTREAAGGVARRSVARLTGSMIVAMAVILAAVSAAIFFFARRITLPLKIAVERVEQIAGGDLTASFEGLTLSEDETGRMLASLRSMTANLREMIAGVKKSSDEVFAAAREMSSSNTSISRGAESQHAVAQNASSVIEEMAASMRSVDSNAEVMAERAERTGTTITELGASIRSVADSAQDLSSAVEQTSSSIEEIGASITEIARTSQVQLESSRRAGEWMGRVVESIVASTRSLDQAEEITRESGKRGEEGGKAARQVNSAMQRMAGEVQAAAEAIRKVHERSGEISNILGVITDIADQTNLLALNAAIIAAQAGEHGKGFGVVAEEVRDLATRSMDSAREIEKAIHGILQDTRHATDMAERTTRGAAESAELARTAGASLDTILEAMERAVEIVAELNRSGQEQKSLSSQAMETMKQLEEISSKVYRSTEELRSASGQIRSAAERMSGINQKVATATGEQATQSTQVVRDVTEMNELIRQVSQAVSEQRAGSDAMTDAIAKITDVTSGNLAATAQLTKTTEMLARQAEGLKKVAGLFKV